MKNMMKAYLGNAYTENHLRNFCLYWMKASEGYGDEWRAKNDLDCLYFDGDLRADTLMSAWTPVKWVADCLNEVPATLSHIYDRDSLGRFFLGEHGYEAEYNMWFFGHIHEDEVVDDTFCAMLDEIVVIA